MYSIVLNCSVMCLPIVSTQLIMLVSDKDEDLKARDDLRRDRMKERQRDRNLARAAPDKRLNGSTV